MFSLPSDVFPIIFDNNDNETLIPLQCVNKSLLLLINTYVGQSKRSIFKINYGKIAYDGHLELLKWIGYNKLLSNGKIIGSNAAIGGHLEILKWLKENGCPWDEDICSTAAEN